MLHAVDINPHVRRVVCSATGREVDTGGWRRPLGLAPESGKPLLVEYDLSSIAFGDRPGIARYEPLLPVRGLPDDVFADVGRTPIVKHPALSAEHGVELWLKLEGGNPSGSFKDRGLSIGIALGIACGAKRFCLPTQGNAGVSAALFSSRFGLPGALVYMPESHRGSVYHRACELFGGAVRFAGENIAAAGARMRSDLAGELARGDFVDLSTFFEPGRLEGKKTMGIEIVEHFAGDALPDWILYPTGGGTGLVGIWKAFSELSPKGALPRMVAVQSERCAPVVRSFERGLADVEPVVSEGTIADGLDVPKAIMGHRMLAVLRESSGTAVAVTEESIQSAFAELGRHGVSAGMESAALVAALADLRRAGTIEAAARVLLIVTSGPFAALGIHGRLAPP